MIDNTNEYIICAAIWYDDGSIFDIPSFMNTIPTDNRYHDNQPFNMLYSEDLY